MQSIQLNGKHIGNVARKHAFGKPLREWKAWSAVAKVSINGPYQTFTGKTKAECIAWLTTAAETQAA